MLLWQVQWMFQLNTELFTCVCTRALYNFGNWYLILFMVVTNCGWKPVIGPPREQNWNHESFHTLYLCYTTNICSVEKIEQCVTTCSFYKCHGRLWEKGFHMVVSDLPMQALKSHQETKITCFCNISLARYTLAHKDTNRCTSLFFPYFLLVFLIF